jgi:drug/metabolite transporter (DMT)-like permease
VYAFALALLSALLFGASTPASKTLLATLEPFQLGGLLYLGAALGMAPAVAFRRRGDVRVRWGRATLLRLGGATLFGGVLGPVLLLAALHLSLAGSVSLLLSLEGVATAVLGVVFFREHLGRAGWLGVAGGIAAASIVASGSGWPGVASALLTACACTCWALDNHWTALIDGVTPEQSTLVKGLVAGATNLGLGLALSPLAASEREIAAALAVGAICYGVSIALYIRAAHELGATRAQAVFASAPFAGAALAFAVLGEPLSAFHVAGGVLGVASTAALFASQHRHEHTHEPLEHVHSHRHDDGHHTHQHAGAPPGLRHVHRHSHGKLVHAHPHWPDVHHRHGH